MIVNECYRLYFIIRVMFNYGLIEYIPTDKLILPLRIWCKLLFLISNKRKRLLFGERLRLALQELGPVWIKFGQMLSTRRDIFPSLIADQLAILQDQVKPCNGILMRTYIEQIMGQPLEIWFDDFQEQPLASASISQVHSAKLKKNGEEVIIKIIRPDILPIIKADIRLMYRLAKLIPKFFLHGNKLRSVEVVVEYEKIIYNELNLLREMSNTIQFRRNFKNSSILYIPKVYPDYCNKNMMVMERINGVSVNNLVSLQRQGTDMKLLAERGLQIFFIQIFRDSFFHGDMHPGNIFVNCENPSNPKYISIDFGIVGSLSKEDKYYLAANFIAFLNRDYRKVAELHVSSGWTPPSTDIGDFEGAIRTVFEPLFERTLENISFSNVLLNLFSTARHFNMEVQPQLVLLQKSLLYVEGMVRQLYPKLDLWKTVKPFLEKWLKEQTSISFFLRTLKTKAPYWIEKIPEIPGLIYDILSNYRILHQTIDHLTVELNIHRVKQRKVWFLLGIGFFLIFIGVFLLVQNMKMLNFCFILIGLISWIFGWKKII
ncbi:ubiquinone biosynthesis regulatory protein kinase UbiB [Blochmannia endosymbiont of Camponotus (Colobopsis) obliquus]|uniref:ubiquinone biosynthesis regulatory protein kinase UbiB n=1 Tax=Blochmannia endosymbiont of Camponotus (Colobopsis) obliquus TaxID=1505597 RepID=UPI00061A66D5|nr:ubiquinone biosynthesis regulatory protein kinase UbiB [Blochmannia endosymbiont of Camponotus (Colobopsis) obliquus]AKC60762.1 putative ubiquinone biosynthesis protein UbiB [Blochmannia endosymbiont of Camponotus (Colobopsis) obliquus]